MYRNENSAVLVKGARFMPCILTDEENGREYKLNVKEPKLKIYRQFEKLGDDSSFEDVIATASAILSSNKENVTITSEIVENCFTLDEMFQFFDDFSSWITATRNNNPN
jgi:hypothetical protein